MLSFTILSAQSVMERLIEIRRAYAVAHEMMLQAIEEPNLDNSMHIEMRRMFGGSGMQNYKIDYYSGDFSDEEPEFGVSVWSPYFIRVKYNWAARVTVTEYLIDPRTSTLMFVFTKSDDNPLDISEIGEGVYELRKYYYPDGTYCTGSMKVTLPDSSEKTLDAELAARIKQFDSDTGEINYVRYLITIHNQMMNYE
ncbi:MAG: hypothetical protein IKX25_12330 [Bacteroidales bacterium]|nr:hypothetical protein [Bacteroidales bacterium]